MVYIALFCSLALAGLDQIIKYWAQTVLQQAGSITVIPGLFYLTYVRNSGAAFGSLTGSARILGAITAMALLIAIALLLFRVIKRPIYVWCTAVVIGGGIGNLVDRFALGYVVDYLDFSSLYNFPVFNLADCCINVGAAVLILYILITDLNHYIRRKKG